MEKIPSNELEIIGQIRDEKISLYDLDFKKKSDWLVFMLFNLLEIGKLSRDFKTKEVVDTVKFKPDKTPTLFVEPQIEKLLENNLKIFCSEGIVVGEENLNQWTKKGYCVAVDPIDGTWALISKTETFSNTLAFFKDGILFLGVVFNPSTGEIFFSFDDGPTKLIQLNLLGENDRSLELPFAPINKKNLLVNLQPTKSANPQFLSLIKAWNSGEINLLKTTGGSPALAICEAAKGAFIYVCNWESRATEPYDLAAAYIVIKQAGGFILDLEGNPISFMNYRGVFIAGTDLNLIKKILKILSN